MQDKSNAQDFLQQICQFYYPKQELLTWHGYETS